MGPQIQPINPIWDFIRRLADPRNEAATNPQAFPEATIGGALNNAVAGAANFAKGVINLPGQIIQGVSNPSMGAEMLKNTATGLGSDINNKLGQPIKVENGQVTGVQIPSLLHGTQAIYNDPVGSALLLEGAKSILKGKSALNSEKPPLEGETPVTKPNVLEKAGNNLTNDVTNIRVKPSVYGAGREAQIQATLKSEVPGVTAAEKYANLEPTMKNLGDRIQASLDSKPTLVPIDEIANTYKTNLKDLLRSKDLTPPAAQAETVSYLENLYKDRAGAQPGEVVPTSISTKDLFQMKTEANLDYQRALMKQASGQPLSLTEKVQLMGRKTLDDVITKNHPDVKELTLKQSDLYDSAPSLSAARDINHSTTILGTNIPSSVMEGAKGFLGKNLTKVGEGLSGLPNLNSGIGGVLPAIIGANSSEQNLQNQGNNNEPNQELNHGNIVTQSRFQDKSGNFVLPTSTTAGTTYMTDATRRQLEANMTPGTPEYTKVEQQFANEQLMAKNSLPAETMDLMTKSPIIFKFANTLNKELADPNLTSFLNSIGKGSFKNFQAYMDSTGKFVQGLADIDTINTAYTAAMAASSAKLGQALPGPDQLINPGDSPIEAKAKLARMMDNIGNIYNQYKEPFLALSSPSGTLETKTSQPVGAPAVSQGEVEQPSAGMKANFSNLLPIGNQAPGLNGLPQLGQ